MNNLIKFFENENATNTFVAFMWLIVISIISYIINQANTFLYHIFKT